MICLACSQQLEQVCAFKKLCLDSEVLRKNLKEEVYELDEVSLPNEEEIKHICEHCHEIFISDLQLQNHIRKNHAINEERYICFHCGCDFTTKKLLEKHIVLVHTLKKSGPGRPSTANDELYRCELCKKTIKGSQDFVNHIIEIHKRNIETFKPFKCKFCKCRFASTRGLHQHYDRHSEQRNHICSFCGKTFKTKGELKVHELIHLNKRNYFCQICEKGFNTHTNLGMHNLIKHTNPNDWKFSCNVCERKFPIKSNYNSHMRRHMGVKPFNCHLCNKNFVTKDELAKHVLSHSNVRPHKCETCGKEYKGRRVLDMHLKKAHDIGDAKLFVRRKKHVCDVCDMRFRDKNKLVRHMCTHTGEKPFVCHLCEKKFTDKSYVTQHLKHQHNLSDSNGGDL